MEKVTYNYPASQKLEQIVATFHCLLFATHEDADVVHKGMCLVLDELEAFQTILCPVLELVNYNQQYQRTK